MAYTNEELERMKKSLGIDKTVKKKRRKKVRKPNIAYLYAYGEPPKATYVASFVQKNFNYCTEVGLDDLIEKCFSKDESMFATYIRQISENRVIICPGELRNFTNEEWAELRNIITRYIANESDRYKCNYTPEKIWLSKI